MTTYYVATLACDVLVDAENEEQARALALPALQERFAEVRGYRDAKFEIRTVGPRRRTRSNGWLGIRKA